MYLGIHRRIVLLKYLHGKCEELMTFFVNKELFNEYNSNLLVTLKNLFNSNKAEFIEEVKKVITYDRILCFKYKHLAILPSEILNCNDLDRKNALKKVFVTNMLRQELGFSLLIKKLIESTSCSLEVAVQMASLNPARILGLSQRKGAIGVGKDADLVVLNEKLEVIFTMRAGVELYKDHNQVFV